MTYPNPNQYPPQRQQWSGPPSGHPVYPPYSIYPPPAPRANSMAVAALILAFLFPFIGLVLGYIARSQIRRTGEGGGGLATAAIVIGWIWVASLVVIGISLGVIVGLASIPSTQETEPTSQPTITPGTGQPTAPGALTFPGMEEGDAAANAGDTVTINDVSVTAGPLFDATRLGKPYLCSTVTVTNNSKKSIMASDSDWKIQTPRGSVVPAMSFADHNPFGRGEIASGGGMASGDLCISQDQESTEGTWVVLYDPYSYSTSSSGRVGWINKR